MIQKTVTITYPDGKSVVLTKDFTIFSYDDRQFLINQFTALVRKANDMLALVLKKVIVKAAKAYLLTAVTKVALRVANRPR